MTGILICTFAQKLCGSCFLLGMDGCLQLLDLTSQHGFTCTADAAEAARQCFGALLAGGPGAERVGPCLLQFVQRLLKPAIPVSAKQAWLLLFAGLVETAPAGVGPAVLGALWALVFPCCIDGLRTPLCDAGGEEVAAYAQAAVSLLPALLSRVDASMDVLPSISSAAVDDTSALLCAVAADLLALNAAASNNMVRVVTCLYMYG